ncbi:MAG: LLM class flavin-dependent oxidoreductase [Chloroflexi bacterium]|nr:LLM class flavin-dependent oxidoreductase [Chloroflexota bacterium]
MKFGIILSAQHPAADPSVQRFEELLQQVRVARRSGFDTIVAGQHYLTAPYFMYQTVPTLARVAAETGDMTLIGVFLLPLHNPVALAEDMATLDIITQGRFIFSPALGYRDVENNALGIPKEHRLSRFVEALTLIKRLWTEEDVTHEGRHFHLDHITLTLRPVQQPRPPIWIAANNDRAVQRAAQMADAWFMNPHAKLETLERQMALYQGALREAGKPMPEVIALERDLYIAKDRKTAFREAKPYIDRKYKAYVDWGQHLALPPSDNMAVPFDELWPDRFIIGGPDECAEELQRYRERLGFNYVVFRLRWAGMPHTQVIRQLRLLGETIIPAFRD